MLDDFEAFLLVVDRGSFAEAARGLGVVPSTVSKRVAALEEHYGVRLLQRTTRSMSLTAEGRVLFDEARDILASVGQLERRLTHHAEAPAGPLRITTEPAFGQLQLSRLIAHFLQRHPDVRVDLTLTDRVVDLVEEAFDVAIRFGVLPDSDLQARILGENLYYICAAPAYLARAGRPAHPAELVEHACLNDWSYPPLRTWSFEVDGEVVRIEPDGPLQTQDPAARYYATVEGLGVAALPAYVIRQAVDHGQLEVLFGDSPLRLGHIWALHVSREHVPARISAFLDFAVSELSADAAGLW